jgi:pimeloyl-ACP methyl ester carboxylesterase
MTTINGKIASTFQLMERFGDVQYRFFTIHGYRRAFLSAGQGPPLLLIHGIGDSSSTWLPVVESLAADHTVIAPDLLGHGLSDKPRADYSIAAYANGMRDLLSVLDIDRVTVIGHSLGGGVAAQFAYTFPERCERLVLVGTGGIARSVSVLLRLAAAPNVDLLMPTFGSPVFKLGSRIAAQVLRVMGTDL